MSAESTASLPPRIQAKVLRGILNAAQLPATQADALLSDEGLTRADLAAFDATLPFDVYLRLFEAIAAAVGSDSYGLTLSTAMGPELIGAIGYAFVASPDLATALGSLSDSVFSIQDATRFTLGFEPAPHVRYAITDDRLTPQRQDVEFSLGYVDRLIRLLLGAAYLPAEVWFEHPRPRRLGRHEAVFRCPVFFEQDINAIWFRPADFTRRGAQPDANLVALMHHYVDLLGRGGPAVSTFSEQVKQAMALLPEGVEPKLAEVSRWLGMSPSTLGRRLRDEGQSFRLLAQDARIDRAARLLRETGLSVYAIAERTGYAETASFTRAFRARTGQTPSAYRSASRRRF